MRLHTFIALLTVCATSPLACLGDGQSGERTPPEEPPRIPQPNPTPPAMDPGLEREQEENFRSPVVSGPYLWSANPETNRVARIDARSLQVDVLDGGHGPTFVAALSRGAGQEGAVVLNVLGDDASVFTSAPSAEDASGSVVTEVRFPVQRGASAWSVGPEGNFAIAWSRFEQDLRGPLDGYQDLTLLSLAADPPLGTRISAGFRPTQVIINNTETRAYVVSDPGISVIDLSSDVPKILNELPLPDGGEGYARDVSFTPSGDLALVRLHRRDEILIVRTEDDARVTISLPAEVTDLDLSEDGKVAVAVMRGQLSSSGGNPPTSPGGAGGDAGEEESPPTYTESHIAVLRVPEIFDDPEAQSLVVTPELVGSVVIASDATSAIFYTNAVDNPRVLTMDVATLETRVSDLQAPVQAAFLSEDGSFAAAIMTPPAGSSSSGAFALFVANENLPPRITGTNTPPRFIAISGARALVTTWGSETLAAAAYLGKFPDLAVDRIELQGEPLASGMVPEAKRGFVAQTHPEGRVTFIDWETSLPATVTGFELSSRVVQR